MISLVSRKEIGVPLRYFPGTIAPARITTPNLFSKDGGLIRYVSIGQ